MEKKVTMKERVEEAKAWCQHYKPVIKATVGGALIGAGVASAVFLITGNPKTVGDAAFAVIEHYF